MYKPSRRQLLQSAGAIAALELMPGSGFAAEWPSERINCVVGFNTGGGVDTMTRILPNRTTIFLPHRISTLRMCDMLLLLHKGRVVATGTHKELLTTNPLYRHLHYLEFNEMAEQV